MAEETCIIHGKAGQPITLSSLAQLGWSKQNYIFLGYGKSPDTSIIEAGDGGKIVCEEDTELYAIWVPTDYLCFTAQEDNVTIKLDNTSPRLELEYSTDYKSTWLEWLHADLYLTGITLLKTGDSVYIRAKDKNQSTATHSYYYYNRTFSFSGKVAASGNIMSLLDKTLRQNSVPEYCFYKLFEYNTNLVTAPELPATLLNKYCYSSMFDSCTNLVRPPSILPALYSADACYLRMFSGCTNLTAYPKINIIDSSENMFYKMFYNCQVHDSYIKLNMPFPSKASAILSMFYDHGRNMSVDVNWTEFDSSYSVEWLQSSLSRSTGTFICPAELSAKFTNGEIERTNNTVPYDWTIISNDFQQ